MVLTKCKVGKEIEKTIAENRFFIPSDYLIIQNYKTPLLEGNS